MKAGKLSLIALLVFIGMFVSSASASSHLLFPDMSLTYGGDNELNDKLIVYCDSSEGSCPHENVANVNEPDAEAKICGGSIELVRHSTSKPGYDYEYYSHFDAGIPEFISCGQGIQKPIDLDDIHGNDMGEGGSITVKAENMNPHKGKYMYVYMNVLDNNPSSSSDYVFHNFLLSDTQDGTSDQGDIELGNSNKKAVGGSPEVCTVTPNSGIIRRRKTSLKDQLGAQSMGNCDFEDPGGGKGNAEDVWKADFFAPSPNLNMHDPSSISPEWSLSSWSPVHRNGDYFPDGEIIRAYEPIHNNGNSMTGGDGPYFFICRKGAMMDSLAGPDATSQVVNLNDPQDSSTKDKLYKCDTPTPTNDFKGPSGQDDDDGDIWDWDRVAECSDDLDNDKPSDDSLIDHDGDSGIGNDPDCSGGATDKFEADTPPCPAVITYMKDGSLMGNYSRSSTPSGCDAGAYYTYSDWKQTFLSSGLDFSPKRFQCEKGKSYVHGKKDDICGSADYKSHTGHTASGVTIEAVQYFPSKGDVLEEGKEKHGTLQPGDTWNFKYADRGLVVSEQYNGWISGIQTLHMAEKMYDGGSSDTTCEQCHKNKTWAKKGLVDTFNDGYKYPEYIDSWTYGNYSGEEHDGIGSPDAFKGGFAGDCLGSRRWTYDSGSNEWGCFASPDWQQAVMLPTTAHYEDKDMIGVLIMPYNWKDSSPNAPSALKTYKEAWSDFHSKPYTSDQTLDKLEGMCYPSSSFKLSFSDAQDMTPNDPNAVNGKDYFHKTIDFPQSRDQPLALAQEIQLKGNTSYRCRWKYIRNDGKQVFDTGKVVDLKLNKYQSYSNYFKNEYSGLKEDYTQNSQGHGLEDYVASLP